MKIKKRLRELNENLHKVLVDSGWIPLKEPRSLVGATVVLGI